MIKQFYHCSCYYSHNIYIKAINKHFIYHNEDQFHRDYEEVLNALDCNSSQKESIIQEINAEVNRRKLVHEKTIARKKFIEVNYNPFDRSIYTLKEDFLEPSFINLVNAAKLLKHQEVHQMVEKISVEKMIYSFPVLKLDFCHKLLKELSHFEESSMPKERPNTMNNYGILLDDLGFHDHFTLPLRVNYLDPLAKILFPEWTGQGLDSHRIFTVGYKSGQDTELGYHYDNSEVTLNVCLGKKFEGGELYFGDMNTDPIWQSTCIKVFHKVGYGILHRGQQYHGALPIASGERKNLILWMRSSSIRNVKCPMCGLRPSLNVSNDYGDGFTKSPKVTVTLNVCLGKRFEGGQLLLGDMKSIPMNQSTCLLASHNVGHGILHRGQQYHGALSITSGERQNLIIWMRSSSLRNSQCPRCGSKPSHVPCENYGDGFTKV